jgi:hypothetical protein
MNDKSLLICSRLPARLTPAQVGELLNFTEAEVTTLARLGLLKPLADPSQNSHKWYSARTITALAEDERWLSKATQGIYKNTRERNHEAELRPLVNSANSE